MFNYDPRGNQILKVYIQHFKHSKAKCVGNTRVYTVLYLSICEDNNSVEHVEYLQSWLVDGEHYSSIGGCQSIQMSQ